MGKFVLDDKFLKIVIALCVLMFASRAKGYFLGLVLGTSASESLSAAGNIFVGQTEAPLLVRVRIVLNHIVTCPKHDERLTPMSGGYRSLSCQK